MDDIRLAGRGIIRIERNTTEVRGKQIGYAGFTAAASVGFMCSSVIVSLGTGLATGRPVHGAGSMSTSAVLLALLAGIIGSLGCFMVVKALSSPNASTANVMALVSTSVVFSLVFSMAFLREIPEGPQLVKTVGGILLMTAGAVALCL